MTPSFVTLHLDDAPQVTAPDGALVHVLARLSGGSFAQFSLKSGEVSRAVTHKTVEEIWFVIAGAGEIWRKQGKYEEVTPIRAGHCLTIPLGVTFQFRALGAEGLRAVAVTMPPWPTDREEAIPATGKWPTSMT